jgi:hypothetical protein
LTDRLDEAKVSLEDMIRPLEEDADLLEPESFRRRSVALDLFDAYFPDQIRGEAEFGSRVNALRATLEAMNSRLYQDIRREIRRGAGAQALLPWSELELESENTGAADGFGYDHLDELISGVFRFDEPDEGQIQRKPETVFYQPTPARHIFGMIQLARATESDVLIDLGAGLGHVVLITSICAGMRSIGIELERPYVDSARRCAERMNLRRVEFLHQDARAADLSMGTVFYLHTPFSGSILNTVLGRLRHEAATRTLKICTFGPCTAVVANESWLEADEGLRADRIGIFSSRG